MCAWPQPRSRLECLAGNPKVHTQRPGCSGGTATQTTCAACVCCTSMRAPSAATCNKPAAAAPQPPGFRRSDTSITSTLEGIAIRKQAIDMAREALGPEDKCHVERNAEYGGEFVVAWGETHLKVREEAACWRMQMLVPERVKVRMRVQCSGALKAEWRDMAKELGRGAGRLLVLSTWRTLKQHTLPQRALQYCSFP